MPTVEELLPEAGFFEPLETAESDSLPKLHRRFRYFENKYRVERVLGVGLLVPALPVIAVCWAVVRLTSKGPGIFRQTRVGHRGQEFQVLKLRTMRIDAEANGPQWSAKGDPRITSVGRVLRTLHLDELPQLINVAKGEMVLVGPRPERPEFVDLLTELIPGYQRRLIVKPGITGLAQINLPPDSDLRSVERKQVLDLHHIDNADLWLDKRMVLLTTLRVFCISNDRLTRWMGLDRKHLLERLPVQDNERCSVTLKELLSETKARESWLQDQKEHEGEDAQEDWNDRPMAPQRPR
jgi:lipopolysaccharide/colanic/teichoic acid biosynthesis glycosyltransferase